MKRFLAVVMAATLTFGSLGSVQVFASNTDGNTSIATKTSKEVTKGRFEVEVNISGEDPEKSHDEVIVMVDGSYSTTSKWPTTRNVILEIGKKVFENNGNTLLTIMTFGVADNIVLEHVEDMKELDKALPSNPQGLLYGRSATNCEIGFLGIEEYIEDHDNTLNEVQVIYITDGDANTDETKHTYYNWDLNSWLIATPSQIAAMSLNEEMQQWLATDNVLSNAHISVFGNLNKEDYLQDDEETLEEQNLLEEEQKQPEGQQEEQKQPEGQQEEQKQPEGQQEEQKQPEGQQEEQKQPKGQQVEQKQPENNVISNVEGQPEVCSQSVADIDQKVMQYANQVWKDVYEWASMNPEDEYSISEVEKAFVDYDKAHNTHVQEIFYYSAYKRPYPNCKTRATNTGLELAENEKITHMYLVDCKDAPAEWMKKIADEAENVSFYTASSMSELVTTIGNYLVNLSYIPVRDVIVTDYMSKWVELDQATIKVIDNSTATTIWTNTNGWLISMDRPTVKENPVLVEVVTEENYSEGGSNVVGNENGTIYKITWYVKDGTMFKDDNYSLMYEVDVDTDETGFEYNTKYPANGRTTVDYVEENWDSVNKITKEIDVPEVFVNKVEEPKKPSNPFKPSKPSKQPLENPKPEEPGGIVIIEEPNEPAEIIEVVEPEEPKEEITEVVNVPEEPKKDIPKTNELKTPRTGENNTECVYSILIMFGVSSILFELRKKNQK